LEKELKEMPPAPIKKEYLRIFGAARKFNELENVNTLWK
jgi:hypothetical protein